ncbi:MAG: fibronectin type III domain-containing protein [Deltaproteobacteria bacterium]|nr:fibronectin type III domain-containing protein [Deltaproteobacteria bacterium]
MTGKTDVSADADLDGDGDYTIYVIAVDDADEANYGSASTTITLDSPPDSVTGVTAGAGEGRVFLEWTAHPDADIDHYFVYYATHSGTDAIDYDGTDADIGSSPADVGNTTNVILGGLENGVTYYLRVTAVDEGGTESPLSAEVSASPTESQGSAELSGDTEGCFIATAAYGSYGHERVRALRAFRDRVLLASDAGRAFVKLYYRWSPPLAARLAAHPTARAAVRAGLRPLAWYAETVLSPTKSAVFAVFALGFGLALAGAARRKGRP